MVLSIKDFGGWLSLQERDTPTYTHKEMTVLARRAELDGPGSQAAIEFEAAIDAVEDHKQREMQRELRSLDQQSDSDVDLNSIEKLIRCTVALTFEECEHPAADAKPESMERRLSIACDLIARLERIEDFRHDFLLDQQNARMGSLEEVFRAQMRSHAVRFEDSGRMKLVLPNVFKRFASEFNAARLMEKDLRQDLLQYDMRADIRYETRRFDQPIAVAFASALALEAHFEDRVFSDDVATQGAR